MAGIDSILMKGGRIVVPASLQQRAFEQLCIKQMVIGKA